MVHTANLFNGRSVLLWWNRAPLVTETGCTTYRKLSPACYLRKLTRCYTLGDLI
jgi:hypothetical protein